MNWFVLIALLCAGADWFAVARANKKTEYVFKPATMLAIIAMACVWMQGPHDEWFAWFILAGLVLSLAGDVLLLFSRAIFFLFGLVAFLLAHVAYILGMNQTLPPPDAYVLLLPIGIVCALYLARVVRVLRARRENNLVAPVAVYGVLISLMLFSAWATLFRPEWSMTRRAWVIAGAMLFYLSDGMLAWHRFVKSSRIVQVSVMITYHLGQMALAAAMVL